MIGIVGLYLVAVKAPETNEASNPGGLYAESSIVSVDKKQTTDSELGSVKELLLGLRQRLEIDPSDVDGWVLLSKSYYYLNRWQEASDAFESARALGYVGSWQPLPRIDSFAQEEDLFAGSRSTINFKDYIEGINERLANDPIEGRIGSPVQPGKPGITLKITLASNLENKFPVETPVFIFARNVDGGGPPLAVLRKMVRDLPLEIVLDDDSAMMAGRNISGAERVIVGARISISGSPVGQPGDYEQLSIPIPSNIDETVDLVIHSRIGS